MFSKLFGRKMDTYEETLYAPLKGKVARIEEVPDPVFSEKMMGDGLAIKPEEGIVVSPVNGEVVQVFHTKHAIGLRSEKGLEILLHIGLETVNLNGEGIEVFVEAGQKVQVGDKLLQFDLPFITKNAASTITPIVITNMTVIEHLEKIASEQTELGSTPIMKATIKK